MSAADTLRRLTAGRPGWALDADSGPRFATVAHRCGAVVELYQPDPGGAWTCSAGHPGRMDRGHGATEDAAVRGALLWARTSPRRCDEVAALVVARTERHGADAAREVVA